MAIKYTVTGDLHSKDTKGYTGVEKHVEHDPNINHRNKNIDVDRSEFNWFENTKERREAVIDWNEKKFNEYVEQHDEQQRKKHHPERQWGSVKRYLKSKNKATGTLTLGNVKSQGELLKMLCPSDVLTMKHSPEGYDYVTFDLKVRTDPKTGEKMDDAKKYPEEAKRLARVREEAGKFTSCVNRALFQATNNDMRFLNYKNEVVSLSDFLYLGRRATNADEGADHIHFEVGTYGRTRAGNKPTSSLNQALVSLHHAVTGKYCSGKKAMSWLRDSWDQYALRLFNQNLMMTYNLKEPPLQFYRKTKDNPTLMTGRDMDTYKRMERQADELARQTKQLAQQAKDTGKQSQQLKNALTDVKTVYKATTALSKTKKPDKELSPLEMVKGIKGAVTSLKHDADNAKADEMEAKAKAAKHQANAEAAQKAIDEARAEYNRLQQRLRQRRQARQKELQDEIKQAGLEGNKNIPDITDKNAAQIEEMMDSLHDATREDWKKEKATWKDEKGRHEKLQQQNDDLDLQNQVLETKNHNLATYQQLLTDSNNKLTKKNKSLKEQYLNYSAQNAELKKQINEQTSQLKTLKDQIDQQADTITKQQKQIQQLTQQISDSQNNLTDLQTRTATARKSYGEIIKKAAKEIMQHILGELFSIRKRPERFNHLLHFYEVSTKKGYTTDNGKTATIRQVVDKKIQEQKNDGKLPGD